MILPVTLLLIMGVLASTASFLLKKSTAGGLVIARLLTSPFLYLGGGLYVLSALINLWLLKLLPYSVVVPLGSLTYVWTLLISRFLLKEPITAKKLAGVLLILAGVCLIAV